MRSTALAYIGLGANLGNPRAGVESAVDQIAKTPGIVLCRCSSLYGSAPVDAGGPDFVNAVAEIETALSAPILLRTLQALEMRAGRERPYRNAPRTLDLDLLLYGEASICSPALVVPHPLMAQRAFVLRPLAELAPARVSPTQLQAVSTQAVWIIS